MAMIIVETEPGTLVRVPKEEAERLGLKEWTKPVAPQNNKAAKPGKTKKVQAPAVVETVEEAPSEQSDE